MLPRHHTFTVTIDEKGVCRIADMPQGIIDLRAHGRLENHVGFAFEKALRETSANKRMRELQDD